MIIGIAIWQATPAAAQRPNANPKTDTRILYHNGPVIGGGSDIYVIWYGCWGVDCGNSGTTNIQFILTDFVSHLGSTPYFQINTTYPNLNNPSQVPSSTLLYGGAAVQRAYTHSYELAASDIAGIVSDQILAGELPFDPAGLYIVLTSEDISANAVGFCSPGSPASYHGVGTALGSRFHFGFVGHAGRCPSVEASQFVAADGSLLPSPNGDVAGDAMASNIAHLLDTMVTNPDGEAWYDKFGFENATKCQGTFGQTYTTANGARANLHLGSRDFLIQQNWVNDKKGRCAMQQ